MKGYLCLFTGTEGQEVGQVTVLTEEAAGENLRKSFRG